MRPPTALTAAAVAVTLIRMQVRILASGSSGNTLLVASGGTRLLIDAGLGLRQTRARLAACGCRLEDLAAVLLTHEHTDHCAGLGPLTRALDLRLYANEGTAEGIEQAVQGLRATWDVFETGRRFVLGDLAVESFSVPHDAADPVAFVLEDATQRLGIATDLGMATEVVRRRLLNCDALILETNHDEEMVRLSPRPWSLKQRILGRHGHLSNDQAAELLAAVAGDRLRAVYLAHLSEECNTPDLACRVIRAQLDALGRSDVIVRAALRDRASEPLDLA